MKRIYLIVTFFLLLLICSAYNFSYRYMTGDISMTEKADSSESETILSAQANAGNPSPVYSYYLVSEDGYVRIYLDDRKTLYETTSICVKTLPQTLRSEIQHGKYIQSEKELYDFLENYSS